MMKTSLILATLASSCLASSQFSHEPRFLGKANIKGSSYCSVVQFTNSTTKGISIHSRLQDLFISTFAQPFVSDKVFHYPSFNDIKVNSDMLKSSSSIEGFLTWPNEVTTGPASIFGKESVIVSGGWFVPTKTTGGIWYSIRNPHGHPEMEKWIPVIQKEGWFYHRVIYHDMNDDGELDIVSCRVHKPYLADLGFGKAEGRLVYFVRRPGTYEWDEIEINDHCDVFFRIEDLDGDGIKEIIAAEFFQRKLSITYSTHPSGRFDLPEYVKVKIVDDTIGQAFDVEYKDLNGDGVKDFLVTAHQEKFDHIHGAAYGYEIPKDIFNGEYKKHVLASNFPVISYAPKEASPGQAQAFNVDVNKSQKPWIVIAGDGSWVAHLLRPVSQSQSNWTYTNEVLHDCGMTVGGIAVNDVDGDGVAEVIIPCFDLGRGNTVIYTFDKTKKY